MIFDVLCVEKDLSFKETIIYTIKILPCYGTTIIFRVLSFSLTIAFLRGWSAIPIMILLIELTIITIDKYKSLKPKIHRYRSPSATYFQAVYMNSISNLAVLNVYNTAELRLLSKQHQIDEMSVLKSIRLTSIVTFVHHTLVLTAIMVIAQFYPEYFQQTQFGKLILNPGGSYFFIVIGITIGLGFYGMVLALYLAEKIAKVDIGKLRLSEFPQDGLGME